MVFAVKIFIVYNLDPSIAESVPVYTTIQQSSVIPITSQDIIGLCVLIKLCVY